MVAMCMNSYIMPGYHSPILQASLRGRRPRQDVGLELDRCSVVSDEAVQQAEQNTAQHRSGSALQETGQGGEVWSRSAGEDGRPKSSVFQAHLLTVIEPR
ncbi:hypothetical protein XPA_008529 [Xanthoria parietina]